MIEHRAKTNQPTELRKRAEARLKSQADCLPDLSPEEAARLVYELRKRQTELELRNEELRQFKYIVSNSNDMLALLDKNFVYIAANEAYLKAFGKRSDEVVGHTPSEIFGEEVFDKTIRPNAECCLAGDEVHYREVPEGGRVGCPSHRGP
jgi:PAS domain-containing protein